MGLPSPTRRLVQAGRARHPIPAHFSSLAALLEAVRRLCDGAIPIFCAARSLDVPSPQGSGAMQAVWGVLVTAHMPGAAGRSEATLSAWIIAEELPRHVATMPRREAARVRLDTLHSRVRASIQASGFTCQRGQHPVPFTAFLCRAHFCPEQVRQAASEPVLPADVPDARQGVAEPAGG